MEKSYALSNLYKGFNLIDAFLRSYIYPYPLLHFPMSLGYFRCYPTKKHDLSYDVYFFFEIVFVEFWLIDWFDRLIELSTVSENWSAFNDVFSRMEQEKIGRRVGVHVLA